jgi:hypothetical protein
MLPYGLIAPVLLIVLTIRFIKSARVSSSSKWLLLAFAGISVSIWWFVPTWRLMTTLVQIAVSVYVVFYQIATSDFGRNESV